MGKPKSKSAKSKKHKSKIKGKKKGEKGKTKRGKNGKKNGLVHLHFFCFFFCFFDLFFVCFFVVILFFFQAKSKIKAKQKQKKQIEKAKKNNKNANGQVHTFSFFFFVFSFHVFPIYVVSLFFGFEVLFFDFPCVFLFFVFFSNLKNIRTSGRGELIIIVVFFKLFLCRNHLEPQSFRLCKPVFVEFHCVSIHRLREQEQLSYLPLFSLVCHYENSIYF